MNSLLRKEGKKGEIQDNEKGRFSNTMILDISGMMLIFLGLAVSIVFWMPSIFDRNRVKDIMGKRYPLVYIVYVANGPMLIFFGFLLIFWPHI